MRAPSLTTLVSLPLAVLAAPAAGQVVQTAYLKHSHTDPGDLYGNALAIDGDTLVVGAWYDDSGADGVNGDAADGSAPDSGAVFVYRRSGSSWAQEAYLKASNPEAGDQFGVSLDLSGDTLIVGSWQEDSDATDVDGDESSNAAPNSGAAYIFVRDASGSWTQEAYLKASNAETDDTFGFRVQVDGDTAVVSASGEDSAATGVGGDEADNSAGAAGAVYAFTRTSTTWSQSAYIKPSTSGVGDAFGDSLALDAGTLAVGVDREDSSSGGINGDQDDNSLLNAGAVFVFVESGTTWVQQAYIKASNPGYQDRYGTVTLDGDTLIVGARAEDSGATGVNGNALDDGTPYAGAAYVLVREAGVWTQQAYLKASNTGTWDYFGVSVALDGDTAVIGARYEKSAATGINGNQSDDSANNAGCAFVFLRDGATWTQHAYLKADNTGAGDQFAFSAFLSGDDLVIGGMFEDSAASGVDGDGQDDSAAQAGAAYTFDLGLEPGLPYCHGVACPCGNDDPDAGCATSTGAGVLLGASGSASVASDDLVLTATGVPAWQTGLVFLGASQIFAPFGDGQRCVGGFTGRFPIHNAGPGGTIVEGPGMAAYTQAMLPQQVWITAGDTWNFQCWGRDPGGSCGSGFTLSNALALTFAP